MARCGFVMITVVAVIMTVLLQEASALKCCECNENQQVYRDEFYAEKMVGKVNQEQCAVDPNGSVVCIKAKKTADGGVRLEYSAKKLATMEYALETAGHSLFPKNCETELCNGSAQYGPVGLIIAIPVIIAKMISL